MRTLKTLLCAGLLGLAASGCTWHRVQSNTEFRDLDVSAIQVGKSTWRDVLDEFGPPSGSTTERIRGLDSMVTFRYACADQKTFTLLLAYILFLPFRWGDSQTGSELVVEFGDGGIVSDMYTVKDSAAWRPFQSGGGDREVTFHRDEVKP